MTNTLSDNAKTLIELSYSRCYDRLQLQASIASAADQRALVSSTLSIAAAALVFGALADAGSIFLRIGSAVFFSGAALFSSLSAMPGKLYSAGGTASELEKAIDDDADYHGVLLGFCQNFDLDIAENEKTASTRAHLYRFAILLFTIGIGLALVAFLLIGEGGRT
ncbi:hypothetical protein J3456_11565 [Sulfitobacter sp. NFXS29]|uniref:hypothetical protein n=1 Tax=Sulfitobacter sp. NFXS29 TaxID=2818438 RepID=UPI0032DEC37A